VIIPAPKPESSVEAETPRLRALVDVAGQHGRTLCLETHIDTLTQDPLTAERLAQEAQGLGLTLDPSHYLSQGRSEESWRCLYPYVRHVHLRDAGPGRERIQTRWGQGQLPLATLIQRLRAVNYQGALSVEYISPGRLGLNDNYPLAPEVRAAQEALVRALGSPNL